MECGHRYKINTTMCTGHSATTDNDHHTADNQHSRCCKLHADWSVRNVTEYDSLLMITRSLCGPAIIEIGMARNVCQKYHIFAQAKLFLPKQK